MRLLFTCVLIIVCSTQCLSQPSLGFVSYGRQIAFSRNFTARHWQEVRLSTTPIRGFESETPYFAPWLFSHDNLKKEAKTPVSLGFGVGYHHARFSDDFQFMLAIPLSARTIPFKEIDNLWLTGEMILITDTADLFPGLSWGFRYVFKSKR